VASEQLREWINNLKR